MTYLPSLPPGAVLLDVFRAYPEASRPLLDYHQAVLRGPSPLTVAERELIAAYVSGLNACRYCHGVHTATAEAFGFPEGTLGALLAAGWEEQALHDAVAVCGLFNLMNRLVEGLGITAGEDYFRTAAGRLSDSG